MGRFSAKLLPNFRSSLFWGLFLGVCSWGWQMLLFKDFVVSNHSEEVWDRIVEAAEKQTNVPNTAGSKASRCAAACPWRGGGSRPTEKVAARGLAHGMGSWHHCLAFGVALHPCAHRTGSWQALRCTWSLAPLPIDRTAPLPIALHPCGCWHSPLQPCTEPLCTQAHQHHCKPSGPIHQ